MWLTREGTIRLWQREGDALTKGILKTFRILAGLALIGLLLSVASWTVRDCPTAPYVYENCLWLRVRDRLHLPQSKMLRGVTLELVGLTLLAGIYLGVGLLIATRKVTRLDQRRDPWAGRKGPFPDPPGDG